MVSQVRALPTIFDVCCQVGPVRRYISWAPMKDSKVWHFTSQSNSCESGQLQFNFLASHYSGQGNLYGDVISCSDGDKPDGGSNPTNPPPTDEPGETYPPLDGDNQDCNGPNGRNVAQSQQSVVGGYNPSSGTYDYAEVSSQWRDNVKFFLGNPQINSFLWSPKSWTNAFIK